MERKTRGAKATRRTKSAKEYCNVHLLAELYGSFGSPALTVGTGNNSTLNPAWFGQILE